MRSEDIPFPVYVLAKDCGEVTAYPSIEKMQGYTEAIDVEGDQYEAWDANGRQLHLKVGPVKSEWLQIVKSDQVLAESEFAKIKGKSKPYRDPESLLGSMGRLLKAAQRLMADADV